jgi:hypothetical protein
VGDGHPEIPANQETVPCGGYPKQLRSTVSRLGFVERAGVGPQPDLVDHHRTHSDGVAARPGPLRLELLGHLPHLGDQFGRAATEETATDDD